MNVVFESPEKNFDSNGNLIWPNGSNPFNKSYLINIPNDPGVYVIGIKVNNTFYPCYIGETNSLKTRLSKHYKERSEINSDSRKEIFNLSNISTHYKDYYNAIEEYNNLWIFNSITKGSRYKHNLYINKNIDDYLIYFQCSSHLNYKLNLDIKSSCWKDINHQDFYNSLLSLKNKAKSLLNSYITTKKCIEDNFYFIYTSLPDTSQQQRQVIEAEVKFKLQGQLKIFTSGDVTGKNSGIPHWKNLIKRVATPNNYDLSCVQNEIINLTGKPLNKLLIL
jgi:hypothetical protein